MKAKFDKVYVEVNGNKIHTYLGLQPESATEYVNKEALLKWAEGKMTVEGATEGIVGGYDLAMKDLIEHLNSL